MAILNPYIFFGVVGLLFTVFCIWFDRIRKSRYKKVLSKKKLREWLTKQ